LILRRTLKSSVSLEGLGLHSGHSVRLTIHPGERGIHFRRGDYVVEAIPENVSDTTRCTRLGEISTIEHLMSAFAGLEITDADVEVDASELPGLDGSAKPYVGAMSSVGFEEIGERELPELFSRVFLQEDLIKIAVSKGAGHWSYTYATGDRWPGEMAFDCDGVVANYANEIAPARTFALSEEVPQVLAAGLGQGLRDGDVLIVGANGFDNEARFPEEPARHKLLDLIGDLYLSGVPIKQLNVSAQRSGHRTNVAAALQLRRAMFGS
jgi:UDP-3-O-[3-hydroxymyristoyl] N-acetylglucosamine deacetylase